MSVHVPNRSVFPDNQLGRLRNHGEFRADVRGMFELLAPHLERTLQISQTVTGLQDLVGGLDQALVAFDHAVFGVAPDGSVLAMSAAGQALLEAGGFLQNANGHLHLDHPEQDERLRQLIQSVVETDPTSGATAGKAMQVVREGLPAVEIIVSPLRREDALGLRRVAAMVIVTDSTRRPATRAHLMRSLFRLSPVETRMADLLLAGRDTREAADALNITFETARFHVKRVLAKTGTRRQAELVRRMMALPGLPN